MVTNCTEYFMNQTTSTHYVPPECMSKGFAIGYPLFVSIIVVAVIILLIYVFLIYMGGKNAN